MIYKKVQFLLFLTAVLLCCGYVPSIKAQCVTSGAQPILDNGTLTIEFFVSGLIDSDLASPTQGICGVELDFMHEYLGDLTVLLISPSGTIVQLIGPVTTTTLGTNLTRWNISFLPCLTPVTPDAGFTDVWSNDQAWDSFAPYSGSYHPNTGCLENFSVGSANGLWQLVVQDNNPLEIGIITIASLIFCNPAGLQCVECNPIGGILSPATVSLCEGTAFNSSGISVDYGGPAPPVSLYSYMYLLINGNSIINSGSSFSASPPAGSYSICGLSYLTADSMAIDMLVDAGDFIQLTQTINAGSICGQLASSCIDFDVLAIPDTVFINRDLCEGESFSFRGQVYSSTGIYQQTVNGPGSCDSVYVLDITISTFNVITNIPGILDCAAGTIVLDAIVTGNNGPVQYQWSTNTGNIIGPTTTDQIVVNQPGHYIVIVNDGQCVVSSEVDVVADDNFPKILLEGGTLTCNVTSVQLSPLYVPTNGLVSWNGPMGFSSDQPVIDAVIPGTYTFTVSSDLGCSASKMVEVGIDTMTNPLNIFIIEKNCLNEFALITFSDQQRTAAVNWVGPNNYTSNTYATSITDPGIYFLTVIYHNGCQNSTSFLFDGDFNLPSIMASADDTLNCNETIQLSVSSGTPGVTFGWSGPNGFSSSLPMINVRQQGTYYVNVYADNGCRAQEVVEIINGDDIFDYQLFSDTLDCKTDTVQLGVIAPDADVFHWINYPGPDSSQSSISVTTPGNYYLIMTDTTSGCVIEANILIQTNYSYPSNGYTIDTVNCVNLFAEINFVPFDEFIYTDVYFKLPDETIVQGTTLFTNLPGEHQLISVDPAGCLGTWRIYVPFDTLPPVFYLEADTLGCDLNGDITTILFDPLASISWSGPNMFTSSDFNPIISDTGLYVATGFGDNGCSTVVSIHVEADFDLPIASVQADSLDCLSPFARLEVSSPEQILSYQWTDPFGVVISTDTFANVILPGDYIVQVEGTNHCFRADTITVLPVVYPQIRLESDTLTCRETIVPIEAISDIPNPVFGWTDLAGTSLGNSGILNVTHSGPFIISVTGTNGCETRDTIHVAIDTVPPVAVIEMQGEVRCQFRDFVLSGVNSTPPQLDFEWSTSDGFITGDNLLPVIDALDTGLYVLQIERHDNGCRDTAQIHVIEDPNSITMAFLDITQASCAGDSNGQIHIVALQGGVLPVFSQIDGGPPQAVGLFQGLTAGTYNLEITDAEGCKYDTMVTIVPTNPFHVDAGPDQEIYLGESFELSGTSDISVDQIIIQEWDSLGFIFCQDCPLLEVTPFMTSTYVYRVISTTGCILEDEVTIYVIEKGKFYIANVFTPNGDNVNDEIRINAVPGIKKVRKWIIYDRWGDAVFGATDFDPDDLSIFWNGKTPDGEALNPAVFPYMLEVVLINGNTEVHHGTITLIK